MSNINVFIATPCYGGLVHYGYLQSLWKTCLELAVNDVGFTVQTLAFDSLIPRARNRLVADFMASPSMTHLLFIDADLEWDPGAIGCMLARKKDVTVAAYPKKQLPVRFVLNTGERPRWEGNELVQVKDAGTGFMLVRRNVIERMMEAYPDLKCASRMWDNAGPPRDQTEKDYREQFEANHYALFDTVIENGIYLSEDYAFCRRWQKLGGEVWLDTAVQLNHHGSFTYSGNVKEQLRHATEADAHAAE